MAEDTELRICTSPFPPLVIRDFGTLSNRSEGQRYHLSYNNDVHFLFTQCPKLSYEREGLQNTSKPVKIFFDKADTKVFSWAYVSEDPLALKVIFLKEKYVSSFLVLWPSLWFWPLLEWITVDTASVITVKCIWFPLRRIRSINTHLPESLWRWNKAIYMSTGHCGISLHISSCTPSTPMPLL